MNLEERVAAIEAQTARLHDEWREMQILHQADETWRTRAAPMDALDVYLYPPAAADAGEILTLQRAAYVSEAQRYEDAFLPPLTQTLDELEAELREVTALVASSYMRIVGAVRARQEGQVWRIGRLVVAPDRQGQGIGGRLLAAIEESAPPSVREFALFTGASSEPNLRLYGRHGYRVSHHERLPAGPGLTHLVKRRAEA